VIVVLFILSIPFVPLQAQQFRFRNLRVRDGLPSNYITALAQDQKGRLWIGTSDGLAIFDGMVCTPPSAEGVLTREYIQSICRDPVRGMWFTMNDSLVHIDNGKTKVFHFPSREQRFALMDVLHVPGHGIWVGGTGGLARLRGGMLQPVRVPKNMGSIVKMSIDSHGVIWILNFRGLHRFDPSTLVGRTVDSTSGTYFGANSLNVVQNEVFVCTRDSCILQFRNGRLRKRHHFESVQPLEVLQDENGSWWIPTNDGLFFCEDRALDVGNSVRFTTDNNLPSNRLSIAMIDAEKVLWFGSEGNGVISLEDRALQFFPSPDMGGKGVEDRHGRLWMTSHKGIWEYWQEGSSWKRKLHERKPSWPASYSYHIQATDDDRLWVSFQSEAIAVFDIGRPSHAASDLTLLSIPLPIPGVPDPDSFCFLIDKRGRLWTKLRISDAGVFEVRNGTRLIRHFKGFHPDIRAMYEDPTGAIWIGGYNGGVFVHEGDSLEKKDFHRIRPPETASIRAFLRDRKGRMWLGTMQGLLIEEGSGWRKLDVSNGLPNNRVFSLAEDEEGKMWVGTQTGIVSISSDLTSIYHHLELTDSPVGACGIQKNGIVWIATSGVTLYDRSLSFRDTIPPAVSITGVYVNGNQRRHTEYLALSSGENNLRIDVAAVRLRNAEAVRYQYRFIGIDSTWSTPSHSRQYSFPALQSGSYTIEFRALNAELIPTRLPAALRFTIAPPFWQQWWFYPLAAALLVAVIVFFYRIRMQRILAAERIRTRIAADLHDDIGSGLTRIAMMSDVMLQQTRGVSEVQSGTSATALEGLRNTIARSGLTARELVESMSDVVWSLDPRNDTVGQIADRLRVFAFDLADGAEFELDFTVTDAARRVRTSSEISRSLLLVLKEAINNTARHARARHVTVRIDATASSLSFRVEDDGCGFEEENVARRSGLLHMEQRVSSCGGHFEVRSKPQSGTSVTGSIPVS
jgi:signal transduction histidine kinase